MKEMEHAITNLLTKQPYIACLLQRCKHIYSDKIPTAGVRIMPAGIIEFIINPEFFLNLPNSERVGLVYHEMLHLVYNHLNRAHGLDQERANIAMDEEINQFIDRSMLPSHAILPHIWGHEANRPYEYYYNQHLQRDDAKKYQLQQKYQGGLDDNRKKQELKDQINKELNKQKEIVKKQQEAQKEQSSKSTEDGTDSSNESSDNSIKKTQQQISRKEDQQEHNQETFSEQMMDNGLSKEADLSDEISSAQKELREEMEQLSRKYPAQDNPEIQKSQTEQKKLQEEMELSQKNLEDALNKLDDLKKEQQQREKQKQSGQGQGEGNSKSDGNGDSPHVMDNHDIWNTSPATKEEQKRGLANVLNQAKNDTIRQWGKEHIPAELLKQIEETLKKPKVPWATVLRNQVGRSLSSDTRYSRKKPNRKFDTLVPGKAFQFAPKIIIATDCSGSVSDNDYLKFIAEFEGLSKYINDTIECIFFDTKVADYKFHLSEASKNLPARAAYGGTDFQCVIDYANESRPDLLIILTDGAAPAPTKPRFPIIWGIVGGRLNPELDHLGLQILIEDDQSKD